MISYNIIVAVFVEIFFTLRYQKLQKSKDALFLRAGMMSAFMDLPRSKRQTLTRSLQKG